MIVTSEQPKTTKREEYYSETNRSYDKSVPAFYAEKNNQRTQTVEPVAPIGIPMFNKRGGGTEVDNYPVGSQGSKTTVADRYFEMFDIYESKAHARTAEVERPYEPKERNEFKYFTSTTSIPYEQPLKNTKRDIRPTSTTLSVRETKESTKSILERKDKAALAIFVAVALFLLSMVIATGITVNTLQKDVATLERNVEIARQLNDDLQDQYLLVNNELVLKGKAAEMGMIVGTDFIEVEAIPIVDYVEYEPQTNWFDKLCDFLSGIFG